MKLHSNREHIFAPKPCSNQLVGVCARIYFGFCWCCWCCRWCVLFISMHSSIISCWFHFDLVRNIIRTHPAGDLFHFFTEIFVTFFGPQYDDDDNDDAHTIRTHIPLVRVDCVWKCVVGFCCRCVWCGEKSSRFVLLVYVFCIRILFFFFSVVTKNQPYIKKEQKKNNKWILCTTFVMRILCACALFSSKMSSFDTKAELFVFFENKNPSEDFNNLNKHQRIFLDSDDFQDILVFFMFNVSS